MDVGVDWLRHSQSDQSESSVQASSRIGRTVYSMFDN